MTNNFRLENNDILISAPSDHSIHHTSFLESSLPPLSALPPSSTDNLLEADDSLVASSPSLSTLQLSLVSSRGRKLDYPAICSKTMMPSLSLLSCAHSTDHLSSTSPSLPSPITTPGPPTPHDNESSHRFKVPPARAHVPYQAYARLSPPMA